MTATGTAFVRWFGEIRASDVGVVGGKNANLGEMIQFLEGAGIRVPGGFATTAQAYWVFLRANGLEKRIAGSITAWRDGKVTLGEAGAAIRRHVAEGTLPPDLARQIATAYADLSRPPGTTALSVAVRSSATAEDLPEASFAGAQRTFLNVQGVSSVLDACRHCYASLFEDRAIAYREEKGIDQLHTALSIGIQRMVRSDIGSAGVAFTLDPDTGFPGVVVISAARGLGESVVQGTVTPDEYVVFKPLLQNPEALPIIEKRRGTQHSKVIFGPDGTQTVPISAAERRDFVLHDDEVLQVARWAQSVETHYARPMDIEWAKDGQTGEIFIVQARPETVQSRRGAAVPEVYRLSTSAEPLVSGISVGEAVAVGRVRVLRDAQESERFQTGEVLVAAATDPDWVPVMRRAAAVVTDQGGRTSHAAIVSRELGVPGTVGTGNGTAVLRDGQLVTVSCASGAVGHVYEGAVPFDKRALDLTRLPRTRTQVMINLGDPGAAFRWWRLPTDGVGLARMEFIITDDIKVHPMALVRPESLDAETRARIEALTEGYSNKADYFVDLLAWGIARIAASQFPKPVIVRTSDFKTNEYANLIGGSAFEPKEENPMLGFRGASRYYSPRYREGFALECQALKKVREVIGLTNVIVMIPFCRTPEEADRVLAEMASHGMRRGLNGLLVYMMAEVPSNIVLAEEFAQRFDGFSIGSNDLTQLTLGVDRDSMELAQLFDERHEAVKSSIRSLIKRAHACGAKVGICGQAPSDYPDFAAFLVEAGIDSISLNPDSLATTLPSIAQAEQANAEPSR